MKNAIKLFGNLNRAHSAKVPLLNLNRARSAKVPLLNLNRAHSAKVPLLIIAFAAVIGFSLITCDDGSGDVGGGWFISKQIFYNVTDGEASISSETVYDWISYRNTSDTDYEGKFTTTTISNGTSSTSTYHYKRNGQTYEYSSESASGNFTSQTIYYPGTDMDLEYSDTSTSSGTTSETKSTYTIEPLGDSTYKRYYESYTYIVNGESRNTSMPGGYNVYTIKDGRTVKRESFTDTGVLSSTTTYTLSTDPVIRAKLGNLWLSSTTYHTSNSTSYQTREVLVLSDSDTELVVRTKTFTNTVLSSQYDETFTKR